MQASYRFDRVNFAGHESFPLRYSWLKKGFDCLLRNGPHCFSSDEALVQLGVGKNMVRAIRHWGLVSGVWCERPNSRGREIEVSVLGWLLLADVGVTDLCPKNIAVKLPSELVGAAGLDPYLQHADTWWFLHSQIVGNAREATSWNWLFNRPKSARFEKADLVAELSQIASNLQGTRVSVPTIRRDIDVLVRTYVRTRAVDLADEDSLDSPFVSLGLLRTTAERNVYELVDAPRVRLAPWVILACLSDFLRRLGARGSRTVSIDDLMYGPGSPGRVFRLTEDGLVSHLEQLTHRYADHLAFNETAGLRQLLVLRDLPTAEDILRSELTAQGLGVRNGT
jgi:hypothetical protein